MTARAAATEATRVRITDAALALWRERWYDQLTLGDVAARAGVSLQTVLNHFGSKPVLFGAAAEQFASEIQSALDTVAPGDIHGAVTMLMDDYERNGDAIYRMIALEDRIDDLRPLIARGRAGHRAWIERVFAADLPRRDGPDRDRAVALRFAATEVSMWKFLRRDLGMSRSATAQAVRELLVALEQRRPE